MPSLQQVTDEVPDRGDRDKALCPVSTAIRTARPHGPDGSANGEEIGHEERRVADEHGVSAASFDCLREKEDDKETECGSDYPERSPIET
jgi:hypothetical protein